MIRSAQILVILCCLLSAACSSIPLDPKKPVEKKGSWFSSYYGEQNGQLVSQGDLVNHLDSKPETQEIMHRYHAWRTAGFAATATTVGLAVGSLASKGGTRSALAYGAVGSLAAEIVFISLSNSELGAAIDVYNRSFEIQKRF